MTGCFGKTLKRTILVCLSALVIIPSIATAIEISAEVDRTTCMVGDRINYEVTVTGSTSSPALDPSDYEGFDIVSGPITSTSFQSINGRVTQQSSLQYVLRANRMGSHSIGPARITINRKTYRSNKITVKVDARSSSSFSPGKGKEKSVTRKKSQRPSEIFLVAEADKDTVYRHEMITVSYKLYIRVNVSTPNLVKLPEATGFWVEEFSSPTPSNPKILKENIGGYAYTVAVIRRVGLFPTRTGELTLEPLIAEVGVERSRRSWMRSYSHDVRTVASDPLDVVVLPLPREDRPAGFKGDVGSYKLQVSYDKRQLNQHDALTMKVTISGSGYLKTIDAPEIQLPDGLESYEPTVEEKISRSSSGMRGKKTFTYVIIPRIAGDFRLKPIQFHYFDPGMQKYRTARSGGANINVKPSEGIAAGIIHSNPADVAILGSDIRFIKGNDQPLLEVSSLPYNKSWFYILLALPLLLFSTGIGAELIIEKRFADPVKVRRRKAPEKMRNALKNARKSVKQGNNDNAVVVIGAGLSELTGAIIDEPAAGLTSELLDQRLGEYGLSPEDRREVLEIIAQSDRVRFSDSTLDSATVNALIERAQVISNRLTGS